MERLHTTRRRSRLPISTRAERRAFSSISGHWLSRLRALSITRARRLAITPSSAEMPVSRNTGAIASWMAWALPGSTIDIMSPPGSARRRRHDLARCRRDLLAQKRMRRVRIAARVPYEPDWDGRCLGCRGKRRELESVAREPHHAPRYQAEQ